MESTHKTRSKNKYRKLTRRKQTHRKRLHRSHSHRKRLAQEGGFNIPWPFAQTKSTNTINVANYLKQHLKFISSLNEKELLALIIPDNQKAIKTVLLNATSPTQSSPIDSQSTDKNSTTPLMKDSPKGSAMDQARDQARDHASDPARG
jgi:hypothetical protein